MRIVFFIIDYVPHQELSIRTISEMYNSEILSFHIGRSVQDIPKNISNFKSNRTSDYAKEEILELVKSFTPDVIVSAGWMIPEYNWLCKKLKKHFSIPIVAMSDTPWYGTFRQRVNTCIAPFHIKLAFTHMWVAGIRQYEYARRLGFSHEQIILNVLSADVNLFNQVNLNLKEATYPKNFLFIGRFEEIKGLNLLIKAWCEIENKNGWRFTVIGKGSLKDKLQHTVGLTVKDYMSSASLVDEFQNAGCFILPSLKESWGLVIHEAAAAGIPLIATNAVGAADSFIINGYNGFKIKTGSLSAIKDILIKITEMTDEELVRLSYRSKILSEVITPEKLAASLNQIVCVANNNG